MTKEGSNIVVTPVSFQLYGNYNSLLQNVKCDKSFHFTFSFSYKPKKLLNDFALSRLVLSSMFRVTPGTKDTERHLGIDVVHENSRHRNDPFSDMISL